MQRERNRILAKRQKEKMLRMFDQLRLTKNWDALSRFACSVPKSLEHSPRRNRLTQALAANSNAQSRRESHDGALANLSLAQVNELLGSLAAQQAGGGGADGGSQQGAGGASNGNSGNLNALANSASTGPLGMHDPHAHSGADEIDYGTGGEEKHVFAWQRVWNSDKQPSAGAAGSAEASDSERSKHKEKDEHTLPSYLCANMRICACF